jgi:hypothetical protein
MLVGWWRLVTDHVWDVTAIKSLMAGSNATAN